MKAGDMTFNDVAAWPGKAENWLDSYGKGAWIAATILGFFLFWPIGLFLLAYMIWGKKMFKNGIFCSKGGRAAFRPSGNLAFDSYKADMLNRLQEEQSAFDDFLRRLREAKDKSEFDAFMDERSKRRRDDAETREDA